MEPFASVEEYEARYGVAGDPELLAEILLDATRLIASELERAGLPLDDDATADRRMQVCRAISFRAMEQSEESQIPFGATQFSQGAGVYTQSCTLGNPYRDIYLTKAEKRLLGIGRSRIMFVMPGGDGDEGS
ncbi:MAG: hypothetical protein HFJ65_03390 [Eggerthellaceae bacterium]|nr:hypothetical protein [Eggerthellaceae bacterium]